MRNQHIAFALLWFLIVAISAYDGCWVLANRSTIRFAEQNPAGRLLLHWNDGDVWLLLAVKATGTLCAATLLLILYWTWPRLGWFACSGTAIFQLLLLLFLSRP